MNSSTYASCVPASWHSLRCSVSRASILASISDRAATRRLVVVVLSEVRRLPKAVTFVRVFVRKYKLRLTIRMNTRKRLYSRTSFLLAIISYLVRFNIRINTKRSLYSGTVRLDSGCFLLPEKGIPRQEMVSDLGCVCRQEPNSFFIP